MTGDEMRTTMEFILNQQAKVTVNLEILTERLDSLTERVDRLTVRVDKLTENQENYNQAMALLVQLARSSNEQHDNMSKRLDEVDERIIILTDAQIRTDESIKILFASQARTEESIKALVESQARTDGRLNNLAHTVERHINNGRDAS